MKHLYTYINFLFLLFSITLSAQQLPNSDFEDWSGTPFDGVSQPKSWNYSNVTQMGIKFNFAQQVTGHSGWAMKVEDQDLGALGITETSPGYISLGTPWVYVESVTKIKEATAGTYGGIAWSYRPDSLSVWIKRTGSNAMLEDFHILYYAWKGTAKGDKYKAKNGSCTSVDVISDEESDIRQSTDGNECGTITMANQVSEGWLYGRQVYGDWTLVKIPIYYMNDDVSDKMNIIFSASNYPNFRANSGLYAGNALFVDDVQLIYSSKIDQLLIDGVEWKSFDPNSTEVQYYTLGKGVTTIPAIKAIRGVGKLTNNDGTIVSFNGRKLQGNEISINYGIIDETPTTITVTAEDGSTQTTYQIFFTHKVSTDAHLASILADGKEIPNFNSLRTNYTVEIPYGSSKMPVLSVKKKDDKQAVSFTQPNDIDDITNILVTAADKSTTLTYTLDYKQALLSDNELVGIKINGELLSDFIPGITRYSVDLPLGTTEMPIIEPIKKYAEQDVKLIAPATIDGGVYQIVVSTPGAKTPTTYKLTFALKASSNCSLKNIFLDGKPLAGFSSDVLSYNISLPIGTTSLPVITWTEGDSYQTISIEKGGLDGTTRIIVTAANGDKQVYKLNFSTAKSTNCTLDGITLDGIMLEGFDPATTTYYVQLPIGTTALPEIIAIPNDPYETITIRTNGINGTTRISVVAGDGVTSTIYQIIFSVAQATNATLKGITIDGAGLPDFDPNTLEYYYTLPSGTTELPVVGYTPYDQYQTITTRSGGVNGDYKIIVRPQSGSSQTYIVHFEVFKSDNAHLQMIFLDGVELGLFQPDMLQYEYTLPDATLPSVTYLGYSGQKIFGYLDNDVYTIKVTAENGNSNIYTIKFSVQVSDNAFLDMIYLDGDSLEGFMPEILTYKNIYIQGESPRISVTSANGQQVTILSPAGAGTAKVVVTASDMSINTYLLDFVDTTLSPVTHLDPKEEYVPSADVTLQAIQTDGIVLPDFDPSILEYTISIEAGASLPTLTFVPNSSLQSVVAGPVSEHKYEATVTAEDGIHAASYVVNIQQSLYSDAYLQNVWVDGEEFTFVPQTTTYHFQLEYGQVLPSLTYESKPGQTVILYVMNDTTQHLDVTAQDGTHNTYIFTYTREVSNNALLQDILIDGVSLSEFDAHTYSYTDTLAFRTLIVPSINAIGAIAGQTITTYFSTVNSTTYIHVVAQDGVTSSDYSIFFPTRKSSNVELKSLSVSEGDLIFNANTMDYTVHLAADIQSAPALLFEKGEKEQIVTYIARPINQPSQVVVQAENGDKRTYTVTFIRDVEDNYLDSIIIYPFADTSNRISLAYPALSSQTDFDIQLPYAATQMEITYTKRYPSQTVLVEPGGIYRPTTITVLSNDTLPTVVYTLNPHMDTQNPAILTGISVADIAIEDFEPNRFSYIVNFASVAQIPSVKTSHSVNVSASDVTDYWGSTITVTSGIYTNIYRVFFHYSSDVIPNGEFNSWTSTATTKSDKPSSWNVPGDYLKDGYLWTVNASESIKKASASSVTVSSVYWAALKGAIPPVMNIADMSAVYGVNGATTVTPSGFIGFHNTPDQAVINYKYPDKGGNGALFRFRFVDNNGKSHNIDHIQTEEKSQYADYSIDLNTSEINITGLDIIIDGTNMYPQAPILGDDCSSELYIDYIRFMYNNRLKALQVNGKEATLTDNAFEVTIDAEDTQMPQLIFTGEVQDQAQKVIWKEAGVENNCSIRRATITNYGEDGLSSEYQLEVKRPLSDINTLNGIVVNGSTIPQFDPDQTEYIYSIDPSLNVMPDVQPILASNLQTCTMTSTPSSLSLTITSEAGESNIYVVNFVKDDTTATLANIYAVGVNFSEDQFNYTIESNELPTISFVKKYDAQQVTLCEGRIDVKAPNGNTQQYIIQLTQSESSTSGQLSEMEFNGNVFTSFAPDIYHYQQARPDWISFTRKDITDSVVYIQTPDSLVWEVYGTEHHTYVIAQPTEKSSSTELTGIFVNDQLVDEFDAKILDYFVYSDSAVQVRIEGANADQQIAITQSNNIYSIEVTAQDGSKTLQPYTLTILPTISTDATLKAIYADRKLIPNFDPNLFSYTITLPAGEYKKYEPTLPTITYLPADNKAKIEVDMRGCNDTTKIYVEPSDKNGSSKIYALAFMAEPSHNALLSNIAVNDVPVENFKSNQFYYSVSVTTSDANFDWRSDDNFQTVYVDTISPSEYTLRVVAQDQTTSNEYHIFLNKKTLSNDATLKNILINGQDMSSFYTELNSDLLFASGQNKYIINMPHQQDVLPQVSAILKLDDQHLNMRKEGQTIYLDVTAPDSSINTYTLQFVRQLSQNSSLDGFYLDGEIYTDFYADQHFYLIDIPVGETYYEVTPIRAEPVQQCILTDTMTNVGKQLTLTIIAEDQIHKEQYIILFRKLLSDVDTVKSIVADSLHFQYGVFTYNCSWPYGKAFPEISLDNIEPGDGYQTIRIDTIEQTNLSLTRQIVVTAENGQYNRYTITYTMHPSNVTTLRMIWINGIDSFPQFKPYTTEYIYTMPIGATQALTLIAEGDSTQTIVERSKIPSSMVRALSSTQFEVSAQNGDKRIYTITFVIAPDTVATLSKIFYNNKPVPRYDESIMDYSIQLTAQETQLPLITYTRNNENQQVEILKADTNQVQLIVTAEDGISQAIYTLTFLRYLSDYHYLAAIFFNDTLMEGFSPTKDNYEFKIDSLSSLPEITYTLSEPTQQVIITTTNYYNSESLIYDVLKTLKVVPENKKDTGYYEILFHIKANTPLLPEESENANLSAIYIRGQQLSKDMGFDNGFISEITDYHLVYPIGYNPELFFTDSDVTAIAQDSLAMVLSKGMEITRTELDTAGQEVVVGTIIHILVLAPAGNLLVYNIYQDLTLDSLNRVTDLLVTDYQGVMRSINNFRTSTFYYEYALSDTRNTAPDVSLVYANPESRFAYVDFERANNSRVVDSDDDINYALDTSEDDPTYHICYHAENGTKYTYKIKFRRSEIKRSQKPMEGDVLIQHIPGTKQIAVASLRANVMFGLYDMAGHMVELVKLEEGNPNNFEIITDGYGQTYFGHLTDYSSCTIITLDPSKLYFWVFTEGGKRKIKSGKIVILP